MGGANEISLDPSEASSLAASPNDTRPDKDGVATVCVCGGFRWTGDGVKASRSLASEAWSWRSSRSVSTLEALKMLSTAFC